MTTIARDTFATLADRVCQPAPGAGPDARVLLYLESESSTFLRFNGSRLRQLTLVEQCTANLSVVAGGRRLAASLSLAMTDGGPAIEAEAQRLCARRDALFGELAQAPPDPHLLLPDTRVDTVRDEPSDLPPAEALVAVITAAAADRRQPDGQPLDLVGFYAGGPCIRAFADSRGQRNWHRVDTFLFEWSLYSSADPAVRDKAVKARYAGRHWDDAEFGRRLDASVALLEPLAMPDRSIAPGRYRALLMPEAVAELLGMMAWGGFGLKERRTGTSPLSAFASGASQFANAVTLSEAPSAGLAPRFTADGFVLADTVSLIDRGQLPTVTAARSTALAAGALVGPRSAAEFGVEPNSGDDEIPVSLALACGHLPMARALTALGEGILIGNLWYLNFSDRNRGRITGMTRFASFRVDGGRIVAPIGVMRFDDALFELFGSRCEALTDVAEFLPSALTWGARTLSSTTCPGLLVDGMDLTL
ncbi:MAG: metallopeptidase TldD-related protein [Burkholderiaceae bacterium]